MNFENKLPWLQSGYSRFAQGGPSMLKVEAMSREVNKSKSSFYHHFADLEVFTEELLMYHTDRATLIAEREAACKNVVPELLLVMIEFKEDLLFNRQLRIHRQVDAFRRCFDKVSQQVGTAIIGIWTEMLGLGGNEHQGMLVLNLSLENFFLQITEETMTYEWLESYVNGLQEMVRSFQSNKPN